MNSTCSTLGASRSWPARFWRPSSSSGTTRVSPDRPRPSPETSYLVYSARLVNDGASSLQAITLTLSDLSAATGIAANSIAQLSIYQSDDANFDAPGARPRLSR